LLQTQPVNIEGRFGKYSSTTKLAGNKIFYYRLHEQYSGIFPAKDYADLVKYYDSIYKADRNKIVFKKRKTISLFFVLFQMKLMENAMDARGENISHCTDENDSAEQCIQRGKNFPP